MLPKCFQRLSSLATLQDGQSDFPLVTFFLLDYHNQDDYLNHDDIIPIKIITLITMIIPINVITIITVIIPINMITIITVIIPIKDDYLNPDDYPNQRDYHNHGDYPNQRDYHNYDDPPEEGRCVEVSIRYRALYNVVVIKK